MELKINMAKKNYVTNSKSLRMTHKGGESFPMGQTGHVGTKIAINIWQREGKKPSLAKRRTPMTPIAAACHAAAAVLASMEPPAEAQGTARDGQALLALIRGLGRDLFMAGGGLRLSVLRRALPASWAREETDAALRELEIGGWIVCNGFDEPSLAKAEDREAALRLCGGIERHYLYVR
jgi:hypothetical protein